MSYFEISRKDTKKMQAIGLRMIKYFDQFARKHKLTYFLCGGNCIGSLRHGGFIEWDDDVDIFMPRKDYEMLKKLWKDTDDYIIQINSLDNPTYNSATTIHDRNSTFVKTTIHDRDVAQGVAMDIFPLDLAPQGFARKVQKFWANVFILFSVARAPQNHGPIIKLLGNILLGLAPGKKNKYRVAKFAEKQMTKYNNEDLDYVTELCAGPKYMSNDYPKEVFSDQLYVDFEDTKLPIPIGYDTYLKMAFGNYMELPPEKDRINHHEYEFIDLDTPYIKYRGDKYYKK